MVYIHRKFPTGFINHCNPLTGLSSPLCASADPGVRVLQSRLCNMYNLKEERAINPRSAEVLGGSVIRMHSQDSSVMSSSLCMWRFRDVEVFLQRKQKFQLVNMFYNKHDTKKTFKDFLLC